MAGLVPFNRNKLMLRPSGFEEFYNMLDDFFNDARISPRSLAADTFKIDVQDTENEYIIDAELPGASKDEVSVEFNEGRLTISLNREESVDEEKKNYIHKERRFRTMQRSVYLADVQPDGIKARLEDGVLHINVPKLIKKDDSLKIDVQ